MRIACLLALLALFVCSTYGDGIAYNNQAQALELQMDVAFTWTGASVTGGADVYIWFVIPDFGTRGETINITSTTMSVDQLLSYVETPSNFTVVFNTFSDINNGEVHHVFLHNVYSPRAFITSTASARVDVRIPNDQTDTSIAIPASFTCNGLHVGYESSPSTEAPTTQAATNFIAARSYTDSSIKYVVERVTLTSYLNANWGANPVAELKIFTRAAGSQTLVPAPQVSSVSLTADFPVNSLSPMTSNLRGRRPKVPLNAVFGIYTSETLRLADCASPAACYGGHYEVVGNVASSQSIAGLLQQQDLGVKIDIIQADNAKDLDSLDVSNGTLSPAFDPLVSAYTVNLTAGTNWITVTPALPPFSHATLVQDVTGPTYIANGMSRTFTITITPEDDSAAHVYTVTVNVAAPNVTAAKPPFPCFGLIGTLNRVGFFTGAHFKSDMTQPDAGTFNSLVCVYPYLTRLTAPFPSNLPDVYQHQTATLTISSNILRSGMFFGVLLAGAVPDPLPGVGIPITPFDQVTAYYIDQFGRNTSISPLGGQFTFPNPDVPGNGLIQLTGTIHYAPLNMGFTLAYDITVVVVKVNEVRTLTANSGSQTLVNTVTFQTLSPLPASLYGQFVISAATALGSPFDPWRFVVMSTTGNTVVLGFIDNQDTTRMLSSTAASNSLATAFTNAVNDPNNAYRPKLASVGGDLAINFGVRATSNVARVTAPPLTPCENGLWYLYADVPDPTQRQCGSIPDPTSSSSSTDRTVLADALVGIFVGFSLALVLASFIYYKWIAKGQSADTGGKSGKELGMELNTTDTAASAPVAVPAANLETPSATS